MLAASRSFVITALGVAVVSIIQGGHVAGGNKATPTAQPECWWRPDPGTCRGFFRRYYYNSVTESCEVFVHGGCGGRVPFRTNQQCEAAHCELMAALQYVPFMQSRKGADPRKRIFEMEAETIIL